ncbi:energy-coupling factor transporter transmembrane protein EcfT [Peptoniphilus sp. KCTC 25270]|uniref:energy-coupling factor transporter transmembrane component T family protein n=1 Tax=Peptoniphilus sp. KCTC 25270 TaxID=2897414 RepID=UPI001E34C028|nr:energy-coupling factor transporter transmembrane component T [Peptoniphilus sp. KCTC 25270]MCD1146574.1 energy-coupling factor transporter transmembrane protein EcfT [Peptoniphilus sp. KCTC 25270]
MKSGQTLALSFVFLFFLSSILSLEILLLFLGFSLVLSIGITKDFFVHKQILPVFPFLLLMGIFAGISFYTGNEVAFLFQSRIFLKVLISALILGSLIRFYRPIEMINGILSLGLPPFMNQIFVLSFRYFYSLWQELQISQKALHSRGFLQRPLFQRLFSTGEWMGGFFLHSIDHSEKIYQAMLARGFQGKSKDSSIWNPSYTLLFLTFVAICLLFLLWERRFFHVYYN